MFAKYGCSKHKNVTTILNAMIIIRTLYARREYAAATSCAP